MSKLAIEQLQGARLPEAALRQRQRLAHPCPSRSNIGSAAPPHGAECGGTGNPGFTLRPQTRRSRHPAHLVAPLRSIGSARSRASREVRALRRLRRSLPARLRQAPREPGPPSPAAAKPGRTPSRRPRRNLCGGCGSASQAPSAVARPCSPEAGRRSASAHFLPTRTLALRPRRGVRKLASPYRPNRLPARRTVARPIPNISRRIVRRTPFPKDGPDAEASLRGPPPRESGPAQGSRKHTILPSRIAREKHEEPMGVSSASSAWCSCGKPGK